MTGTARVLSPILVMAMLLSMLAVMATPLTGTVQALANQTPTTSPVTAWTNVSPPIVLWDYNDVDGDPQVNYEVEVWTEPGGTGTCMWDPQIASGDAGSAVYDGTELDSNAAYYARVRASDGVAGWGAWSETLICWPNIWVSPAEVRHALLTGTETDIVLTIGNNGCRDLEFSLGKTEAWISLDTLTNTVPSSGSFDTTVTIDSTGLTEGEYHDSIVVHTNDPDQGTFSVPVALEVRDWVSPSNTLAQLYPGQSVEVEKTLYFDCPPEIDVFYLVDDTESFADELGDFKAGASSTASSIAAAFPDSRFGLGAFRDFPTAPWGSPGDFAYRQLANLTDVAGFTAALAGLTGGGTGDPLESQYEALYQIATSDLVSWGDAAYKIVVLVTNSGFHENGDDGSYPGAGSADAVAALTQAGIAVFGPGINNVEEVIDIASATGGLVWSPSLEADEIAQQIANGLGILTIDVSDPSYRDWVDLSSGHFSCDQSWKLSAADFLETVFVPHTGVAPGEHSFTVSYLVGGQMVAEQTVTIDVPPVVSPASVDTELFPGDCIDVEKSVRVPSVPAELMPPVDIFLLEDETGSFWDDILNLQALAPNVFDAVSELIPDSRFGVGGFRDFPFDPWGDDSDPDWAYRLIQDFTSDRGTFVAAVNSLTAGGGNDDPESQYEALYQAATGAGVDLNNDGDYSDPGEVAPGLNPNFRPDAVKVVILATDEVFHDCDDWGSYFGDYPGPCRDEVVSALETAGIIVVGIEPSSIPQLHDVAEATGGLVQTIGSSGGEIAQAIVSGLSAIIGYDEIRPQVVWESGEPDDPPLEIDFYPEKYQNVGGGRWIGFVENISVPEDAGAGIHQFTVQFLGCRKVDDEVVTEVLAEQDVAITVFDAFDWITMVYMAADNDVGSAAEQALETMDEATYYGPTRTLVLFDDSEKGDSAVLEKTFSGMRPVDDMGAVIPAGTGEANMGDPGTLNNFISWARENYPAADYGLILWDHGRGWRTCSFCQDWTDDDSLSLRDLGNALKAATDTGAAPLQLVGFDTCLMQMLEVDYQIMDYAEYAVGSEEVILASGWPYNSILTALAGNPGLDALGFATLICDEYANAYSGGSVDEGEDWPCYTLSAKDLSLIGDLADAVDAFASELTSGIGAYDEELAAARRETETFGNCHCGDEGCPLEMGTDIASAGSIDLYHFASLINGSLSDTSIGTAATAVATAIEGAVVCNVAGEQHPNANGIAIYYPDVEDVWWENGPEAQIQAVLYEPGYDEEVDFALDTGWNDYVRAAPRLLQEGYVVFYVPDVLIAAHVCANPIIRLDWPELADEVTGFALTKPVDIFVTPEGAIDLGLVSILYSQADLDNAGILKTQLVGQARLDGEQRVLEKLTMDMPSWATDLFSTWSEIIGELDGFLGDAPQEFMCAVAELSLMGGLASSMCGWPDYAGAVMAVPWLDLSDLAPEVCEAVPTFPSWRSAGVTSLAIAAASDDEYLTPIQYPQNLYQGWNLVSLPVIPIDGDVATILSGYGGLVEDVTDAVEAIWQYDANTGEWHAYSPAAPEASDLTELKDGEGYWFNMVDDATMTVIGSNLLAGPHAPPEYELAEGWNLIGYKGILPMPPQGEWYECDGGEDEVYLGGYLEEDKVGYDRLQGYHRVYDAPYAPDFLYPNDAYWVYVVDPGSIPGLNDENWVKAFEYGVCAWREATADWIGFWMERGGELGLRLAWDALWYACWVIAPSELGYS